MFRDGDKSDGRRKRVYTSCSGGAVRWKVVPGNLEDTMKLLHISDLHIGKRVNEFSMLEDQKYILDQILVIAQEEGADGVMIAGDIYDKSVPSAEAVQVFDRFLTELAKRKIKVFAVSGNHDSPERIAFGAQLMSGRGVYFSPVYNGKAEKIVLEDAHGEVYLYLLPFIKPAVVRHVLEQECGREGGTTLWEHRDSDCEKGGSLPESEPTESGGRFPVSYQDAVRLAVERMQVDETKRNVLIAHQFVTGAGRCDSEDVSVGGLDNVDGEIFDSFDYVALGHIHSPQWVGRETVRYCGTSLQYSFSEAGQEKSVTIVELGEKGEVRLGTVSLLPLHDMRRIRGTYMEVTARAFYQGTNTEDYVQITLTDEEDIPDGLRKLRIIYPNLMRLEYDNSRTGRSRVVEAEQDIERKSELELFGAFYELQNNQSMTREQADFVGKLIEESRLEGQRGV